MENKDTSFGLEFYSPLRVLTRRTLARAVATARELWVMPARGA